MSDAASLLTCYYRPKPGGLCRRLFRGMEALAQRGHAVHYLAVEVFPLHHPGCHFHRLWTPTRRRDGALFWGWFAVAAPPTLLWLAARHRTAHLFAFGSVYGLLLQPARLLLRRPLTILLRADSITNHGLAGYPRWRLAVESAAEGVGLAGARLLAVSRTLADSVARRHRRIPPRRLGVLRNDVPGTPTEREATPAVPPRRAAAVGILEARKNLGLLIEAMAGLEDREGSPGLLLTLYGEGPAEADLRRRVTAAGLDGRVRFAGWRPAAELWREVDLLLMPSRHEGAPNAVLEALAHGIPVLASDLPEHREILPAASLLPVDRPDAWRSALRRLVTQPRAAAELAAAQREASRELVFDWDAAFVAGVTGRAEPAAADGEPAP